MFVTVSNQIAPLLPRTADEIAAAAVAVGLTIEDACLAGVIANLALLAYHADILFEADA